LNFRGTFDHSLDAKHRLTVPAKYRATLAAGVLLAVSPETRPDTPRSVAIWTPEGYDEYVATAIGTLNPMSPRARDLARAFNNNSWDAELDSANRVMIPAILVQYAGLGKDVTVTGSGSHLEVWDRAAYASYNQGLLAEFTQLAASVDDTA
jgi:MraZ protein